MLSSYFPRGGALDEGGSSDLPMSPAKASHGHLRYASSTPALKAVYQHNPTLPIASEVSRAALSSTSSNPTVQTTPSPTESSVLFHCVSSVATVVSPKKQSSSTLSPVPEGDSSFAQKIRYRISSVTRKPVALQVPHPFRTDDTKKLELEIKARQTRAIPTSTVADALNSSDTTKFFATPELEPSHPELDIKPPKCSSGKTFFKDGLSKAHKKFFGRSKESEESQSETSNDEEDEEDVNLIYSNVMIPLEFPTVKN